MKFDTSDVEKGLSDGVNRAKLHLEMSLPSEDFSRLKSKLTSVLSAYPIELNKRFVTLFAELAAIAETSRLNYKEPLLKEEELGSFLKHSAAFFNSFTHA